MKQLTFIIAIILYFISQFVLSEGNIDLSKGTVVLKGSLWAQMDRQNFERGRNRLTISSNTLVGYFFLDQWETSISMPIAWQLAPGNVGVIGLGVISTGYFLNKTPIIPYAEVGIIPKIRLSGKPQFLLSISLGAGILLSFSKTVAIDLGLKPELDMRLAIEQNWTLRMPLGFLGIRAFF